MIARATEADVPRILEIANWAAVHLPANFALAPEPLDEWMATFRATQARYPWIVWREDGRILGFAKGSPHRARAAYAWTAEVTVYIDPTAHGRGIGRALYDKLLPTMDAQGYVTLLAGITTGNEASERLHARCGFVRCATFHRTGWKFDRWHDVGYWERITGDGPPLALRTVDDVWT